MQLNIIAVLNIHLKAIVAEVESSGFKKIWEILKIYTKLDVEHAVSTMIAMEGSSKL